MCTHVLIKLTAVPSVLATLKAWLDDAEKGWEGEGIFRLASSENDDKILRLLLNTDPKGCKIPPNVPAMAVSHMLKCFIRELPVPLLPKTMPDVNTMRAQDVMLFVRRYCCVFFKVEPLESCHARLAGISFLYFGGALHPGHLL